MTDPAELARVVARFAAGTGPVAIDAERASGYRYTHRAYLIQLRRAGAGTAMIDPLPFPDLVPLAEAIADQEWVLHAASQDLPCLAEVGMHDRAAVLGVGRATVAANAARAGGADDAVAAAPVSRTAAEALHQNAG